MKLVKEFTWHNPLDLADYFSQQETHLAFLYSAQKYSYSGNLSFLAWELDVEIRDDLNKLQNSLTQNKEFWENLYFGYMGYESLEKNDSTDNYLNLPKLHFFQAKNLIIFDHQKQILRFFSKHKNYPIEKILLKAGKNNPNDNSDEPPTGRVPAGGEFKNGHCYSNMSKEEYLTKVKKIRADIINGDYYQVNLTRKFFTKIELKNKFSIFRNLVNNSPSPYMAYFKLNDVEILSSSPERFINIDKNGKINTRPIKGTIAKIKGNTKQIKKLKNSSKDQAENLMIVDLMRHDLGISAQKNSVQIEKLFAIDSFATLHHMSSSINAQKEYSISSLDTIINAFPPGSMTGAPKIAAMHSIKNLEPQDRGIYSGCVGYFAGDGSCDLSVIIRTIIIKNNFLEFQVGGGIIYDSDPQTEWQETITKTQGICKALNIDITTLQKL